MNLADRADPFVESLPDASREPFSGVWYAEEGEEEHTNNYHFNPNKLNNLLKVEVNNVLILLPLQDTHHEVLQLRRFAGSMAFLRVLCRLQALQ